MESKVSTDYDGRNRTLYLTQCETCQIPLWLPKHLVNSKRYCSKKCKGLSRRKRTNFTCSFCASTFERKLSSAGGSKSGLFFCSRKCKDKAQRIEGIQSIQPGHYGPGNGKRWYRSKALRDYGKVCQRCAYDDYEEMLDVHHKDGNRENNKSENLEVLCVWCHGLETRKIKSHKWCGKLMTKCDFCDKEATVLHSPAPAEAELACGDPWCQCDKHTQPGWQGFNDWCHDCHAFAWQDI